MLKTKDGEIVSGGREPDRILRRHALQEVTGYSISHLYQLISEGRFPKPIKLGAQASGWLATEVADWQRARIAERDTSKQDTQT